MMAAAGSRAWVVWSYDLFALPYSSSFCFEVLLDESVKLVEKEGVFSSIYKRIKHTNTEGRKDTRHKRVRAVVDAVRFV
jgi:hypothetical protein